MFDNFKNYLENKITLSDQELELIKDVCILKKLQKRQYLAQEGDVWQYNAFVSNGLLKTFSIDQKGQEHIMNFSPENYWTGDRESLTTGNPSDFNILALENSEIILIKKDDFEYICQKIPQFYKMVNDILHKSFLVSQKRIHANMSLSIEEKYHNFIQQFPSVANRIPQHMIASYLGISAETLSRIRAQSAKN
ncbi:Crp/Fnr family transcriptional regulator [Chryseobacterium sp. ERMR1:04]|uniref:Crp/Fnr family transcriptional regulator n=1 Tax=Chryseobacterium sp. ERMR1:04 TaxID=1705393 RepID=UPI0006C83EBB|nr:Crp/Fnr family transcriptional regulator [Chryseobacterium sp. ERMR1:04]KPH14479.1 cyclic nucleotide-binding protein [Chryseobacterium sp. ERMR1:04]